MSLLFLELDFEPVGKTCVAVGLELHTHGKVEISAPQLGIDLSVQGVDDFIVQHSFFSLIKGEFFIDAKLLQCDEKCKYFFGSDAKYLYLCA